MRRAKTSSPFSFILHIHYLKTNMRLSDILLHLLVVGACHGLVTKPLPEKVIVGYASRCDDVSVIRAVEQGVNVVVWSFIRFPQYMKTSSRHQETQQVRPAIETTMDVECIRREIQRINLLYDDVVHLASFGGWNGAHPDGIYKSEHIYGTWKKLYGDLFDGIDWDLEGNDDMQSPHNYFTLDCLDKMGHVSQLAKSGRSHKLVSTCTYIIP